MFITPINGLSTAGLSNVSSLNTGSTVTGSTNSENTTSFTQIFQDAINQVNSTEAASDADSVGLASGTVDDLHTVTINSTKAELALSLVVQIRNKALDAYSEIMRISL